MRNKIVKIITLCALLSAGYAQAVIRPEPPTPEIWQKLDIVPMPKKITLLNKNIPLNADEAVIVIGSSPSRQTEIGSAWINTHLVKYSGKPLPIAALQVVPDEAWKILIGTVEDNPLIAEAVAKKELDVGDKNPGERGYEIAVDEKSKTIWLAGADSIGALYACVTFAELLTDEGGTVAWQAAVVRDWPDCIYMLSGGPSLLNARDFEYREDYKSFYNRLLRWKITGLYHRGVKLDGELVKPASAYAALREKIDYGKERGIGALLYAEKPYVGLVKHHPEAAADKDKALDAPLTAKYTRWIRGWEFDEIRRETARNLAEFIKAVGFTDIGFHDTDTGGFDNPAQWNFRPPASKKRWGDDFAAASAHIHKIYYEEIKKLNPDVRLLFVFYPYNISIFDTEKAARSLSRTVGEESALETLKHYQTRYSDFWQRLHAAFPRNDVNFCIRESSPVAMENWRKFIPGRGAFVWQALMSKWWDPLFSEGAAWTPTFCGDVKDYFFVTYAGDILPLQVLAAREYSWNKQTPGAAPWNLAQNEEAWRHAEPRGEIYSVVLPKLARNVFGHKAAPYLTKVLSCNIDPDQIFAKLKNSGFNLLKTPERMAWAASEAAQGADILNSLWEECSRTESQFGMDDYAFRRFIVLRETLNGAKWVAAIRSNILNAEALAVKGRLDEAKAEIAAGVKALELAQGVMSRISAERPESVQSFCKKNRRAMADKLDLSDLAAELEALPDLLNKYAVNAQVFNDLFDRWEAKGRELKCLRIDPADAPPINGRPEASVWKKAWPIECFSIIGHGRKMADAFTRAKVLSDGDHLFIGVECYAPDGLTIQNKDTIDVFLSNPEGMGNDYAQLSLSADTSFVLNYHKHTTLTEDWATPQLTDGSWPLEYSQERKEKVWTATFKIPLAPMLHPQAKFGRWHINLSRNCYFENKSTEISGILPVEAATKHNAALYPALEMTSEDAPKIAIKLTGTLKTETQTLPDKVATVATFQLAVEATTVLNDVSLTAETYGPDNRRQTLTNCEIAPTIYYRLPAHETQRAEFSEVVESGSVLVTLRSAEGEAECRLSFDKRENK